MFRFSSNCNFFIEYFHYLATSSVYFNYFCQVDKEESKLLWLKLISVQELYFQSPFNSRF